MIEAETLEPVHAAKATQPGADGSREGVSAGTRERHPDGPPGRACRVCAGLL
ncbi:hypothetical protein GCM10010388_22910 [Streptomyces mauvecolor]